MKLLGRYKNGNYTVSIFDDGTKIRQNDLDTLEPSTVESMDIKITNKCNMGCSMCHEDSRTDGKHGDILSQSFLDTLHPYTELAIGGGNPLEHPDLYKFLLKCKERKFLPSMTVNQKHFEENKELLKAYFDAELIYGLGVSLTEPTDKFIKSVSKFPNAVIHIINGMNTVNQLKKIADNNLKILILGYKEFRRGKVLYSNEAAKLNIEEKKNDLKTMLPEIVKDEWFNTISFDNLALKQLDVKSLVSEEVWNEIYMGDDGLDGHQTSCSMFVDMVERKFAKNSCSDKRYDLLDSAEDMYQFLKNNQ